MNVVLGDPLYRPFAADLDKSTSDPEYRLLRQTMRDNPLASGGNPKLFEKLEKAAAANHSGILYESLSQIAMGSVPSEHTRIFDYLTSASENYPLSADRIRVLLQRTEFMAGIDQKDKAIKLLKGALSSYAKEPEVKAIEARLAEWQPKAP